MKENDCRQTAISANEKYIKLLKIGVYRELHKKGLLSDFQLNALIKN